ncbi:ABC transporter-like protein 5 [Elsinoe fawcettii]|nr:ABC transporter-like protein 5 [Elsinoe fawcettii]
MLPKKCFWPGMQECQISVRTVAARRCITTAPLVSIAGGTFHRHYPSASHSPTSNPPLFQGLSFTLPTNPPTSPSSHENWSILSPSSLSRTTFLQILAGSYLSLPPSARSYPALSARSLHPSQAIQYIGFDAERSSSSSATRGAYLSARYESRVEETDWTVLDYLTGNTSLNPVSDELRVKVDDKLLEQCIRDLKLDSLLKMPVGNLSNGQTRRARIAKALMRSPVLMLLDGPFMGLDPPSVKMLSGLLQGLASESRPQIVLSLRAGDAVPEWVTHLVAIGEHMDTKCMGKKDKVLDLISGAGWHSISSTTPPSPTQTEQLSSDGFPRTFPPRNLGAPVVEMSSVRISYGARPVLGAWPGGLNFSLRRNQRLAILGPNGSGKTTLLSLITSDHPQSYAQDIKIFGRSRLPSAGERGITLFELQRRIGHASPEVHSFFPKSLTVRRALESAWADAPMARPQLGDAERSKVDAVLAFFANELRGGTSRDAQAGTEWADTLLFGGLSFSAQRLLLFLRALIAEQEIVVLDEVFSGMDKVVREKAFWFLARGTTGGEVRGLSEEQALIVIAHDKGDVPGCVRDWICLPEQAGEGREQDPPRTGELKGPLELRPEAWGEIWGTEG